MKNSLNIKEFTDYRTFLVAHVQEMKRKRKSWSYGQWAKTLGLKDSSSVAKIIQGYRDPGPEITERLVNYFQFNEKSAQYFRDLIKLEKIRHDARLSVLLMEKMNKEYPNGTVKILDDKMFSIISNWYYLPLREIIKVQGENLPPKEIANQFLFKVTSREIIQAIKTMEKVGLLVRNDVGNLELAECHLNTTQDVASEAIKRFHEQMLTHAMTAIRNIPLLEREFTAVTFSMREANLPKAKELIREFKERLESLLEAKTGDRIYQFQIQFFPLTTKLLNP